MRFILALIGFCLWVAVVRAGAIVRGIEILLYYYAYRLDVEVSAALAKEEGKEQDRSWKIARGAINTASDFPDGKLDESKLGANFHGFTGSTASMGYAKADGLTKIKDPWAPTWEEVKDIVYWKPIPKGSQYSYGGFDAKTMLGDMAGKEPNSVPDGKGKRTKNHFFDFDNMMAIIGKRCADLYDKKPDIARQYMEKISQLSSLAAEGREKESAGYKIDDFKDAFTEKNKQFDKKNPKSITGAIETKKRPSANFGEYDDLDVRRTKKSIAKVAGKNAQVFVDELTRLGDVYTKAEAAKSIEDIKNQDGGLDPQTKDHLRVRIQEVRLAQAIDLHLSGEAIDACSYPNFQAPRTRRRFFKSKL
ncbi:hypothetical protein QBC47DRAFT_443410 [Echria macrotheca]|uniref:Uncharacterized protein n=1 Tax=Echria macrotheca TaxID=438768 RepID=A0AAJ0BEF8_9PEZI|nr:hypothetical protein QBC47DRAFT_443410 [Echria macrotheca]